MTDVTQAVVMLPKIERLEGSVLRLTMPILVRG